MLNVGNKRRVERVVQKSGLSMYNDTPLQEISLDEFESYGIDRLTGK